MGACASACATTVRDRRLVLAAAASRRAGAQQPRPPDPHRPALTAGGPARVPESEGASALSPTKVSEVTHSSRHRFVRPALLPHRPE